MIYIIFEQDRNQINPVEPAFISKFNKSSIKRIGKEGCNSLDVTSLKKGPLFNKAWLLLCENEVPKHLELLQPDLNCILIHANSKKALQKVVTGVEQYTYKIIDNYQIPKEVVLSWIMHELNVGDRVARHLYNRVHGYQKQIMEAVNKLSVLPVVTMKNIDTLVEDMGTVTIYHVVQHMLGIPTKVSEIEILEFIYRFRYADKWLKTSITNELKIYYETYLLQDDGILSLENFREFLKGTDNSIYKSCSEYKLKKLIESHDSISTELVYYVMLQVSCMPAKMNGILLLMDLIKAGGNDSVCNL